jgi:hypothetical protein
MGWKQCWRMPKNHGASYVRGYVVRQKGTKLQGIAKFLPYIDWFLPSECVERAFDGLPKAGETPRRFFIDSGAKKRRD